MKAKQTYNAPHLDALTEHSAAFRLINRQPNTMQAPQQSDPHAELCHSVLFHLVHLADVEHWHRWNGIWCRLVDTSDERGRRQFLPEHLLPLADIIEGCR